MPSLGPQYYYREGQGYVENINHPAVQKAADEKRAEEELAAQLAKLEEEERQRQQAIALERQRQLEAQRQQQIELQRRLEQQRQAAEAERRRQAAELERRRIEAQRQRELELQRAREEQQRRAAEQARLAAEAEAERKRQAELKRKNDIAAGEAGIADVFSGLGDDFVAGREQSYMDYALPQLQGQLDDAESQLIRVLARNSTLDSSVRQSLTSALQSQYDEGVGSLRETAQGFGEQAQAAIQQAREQLLAQNQSVANPSSARQAAQRRAEVLRQQPAYSPISEMIALSAAVSGQQENPNAVGRARGINLFGSARQTGTGSTVG